MEKNSKTTTSTLFSGWARDGKSDSMAHQHKFSVSKMLVYLPVSSFRFLDIGCGNGWVCRKVAQMPNCRSVTGVDIATDMIQLARQRKESDKERYIDGDVLSADLPKDQDVIFAMESLYYLPDLQVSLNHLSSLLKPGGRLIFGCDYHQQNPQTGNWSQKLGVPMHYLSDKEWCQGFINAGLKIKICKHCKDPESNEGWHREEEGTLIIVAERLLD